MSKTTIQLDKSTRDKLDDTVSAKNFNQKVLKLIESHNTEPQESIEDYNVKVKAEDIRPMIQEEITEAMSEVTIDVTIDAEESDVDEADVRNIVEKKLDELKRELR